MTYIGMPLDANLVLIKLEVTFLFY